MEAHKGICQLVVVLANDVLIVDVLRYRVVDVEQCHCIVGSAHTDVLRESTIDISLASYRDATANQTAVITFYRLQCDSEGNLRSYIAEGEVLDVPTRSFGGIGIFAINEMGRFYRHVLIQKGYPHHGAVAFSHVGKTLFEVFKYLGIKDIAYNQPASLPYPTENPWK